MGKPYKHIIKSAHTAFSTTYPALTGSNVIELPVKARLVKTKISGEKPTTD